MSQPAPSPTPAPAAPAAVPPAAPAPTAPPAEPTVDQIEQAIAGGNLEQIDRLMKESTAPRQAPPAQPAAPTSEKEASTPAAPAQPPADDNQPGTKNFRMVATSDKEAEVFRLMKESEIAHRADPSKPVITLEQAFAQVYKSAAPTPAAIPEKPAGEAQPTEQPPPADPLKEFDDKIAGFDTKANELQTQLQKAIDDMDGGTIAKLNREIAQNEIARARAEDAKAAHVANQQSSVEQKQRAAEKADHEAAVAMYPELGVKDSAQRKDFENFIKERTANPDYDGIFASPRWRSFLAREWADLRGYAPANRKADVPPVPAPVPPAASAAAPKTSAPPPAVPKPRASAADVVGAQDVPGNPSFDQNPTPTDEVIGDLSLEQINRTMAELHKQRVGQGRG